MEAIAKRRNLKGSPRKTRLVIDLIRGRNVSQALSILQFTNKRAAKPITKLLRGAIANATYLAEQKNIAIDPDDLWVKSCFVDMGMHKNRRRLRPAPQGRAYQEQRHYCHITIMLSSDRPETPVTKLKKHGNKVNPEALDAAAEAAKKRVKPAKAEKPVAKKAKAEKAEAVVEVEDPAVENVETVETPVVETAETTEEVKVEAPEVEAAEEVKADAPETTEEVTADAATEEAPVEETVDAPAAETEDTEESDKQ
jgi:large subunit ribosomal protein L22